MEKIPIGLIVTLEDEDGAWSNCRPVEAAGGIPLLIPHLDKTETIESLLDTIGGLILAGGKDVDPTFYHESPHLNLKEIDPIRDSFELQIIRKALERDIPILGICRGMQTINVASGGTLFQDISSYIKTDIEHSHPWETILESKASQFHHPIEIDSSSRLFNIIGEKSIFVNSYHHQSIRDLAPGFKITAEAPDGVIEGIESLEHHFVIGVQCHMELLWRELPYWLNLYKSFIKASEKYFKDKQRRKRCAALRA